MSNFKSGSGNLDFGGGDEGKQKDETTAESTETHDDGEEETDSKSTGQSTSSSPESASSNTERSFSQPASDRVTAGEESGAGTATDKYPYFVRRNNVGDERDTRLEIHVRDKVADQEATFRSELAEQLDANEIAKTDAREFALLTAFQHPERVAELMRDEGFGALD